MINSLVLIPLKALLTEFEVQTVSCDPIFFLQGSVHYSTDKKVSYFGN